MKLLLLTEGYGRTLDSTYHGKQVTDPRPNVLVLGRWVNHKGNKLLCGINLNYLNEEQILRLRTNLANILSDRNLRRRVRAIRSVMPDVFNSAYRTYTASAVNIIKPGTLKFFKPKGEEQAAVKGGPDQKPVAPLPIKNVKDAQAPAQAVPGAKAEPEPQTFTGGTSDRVKTRHDRMRGDTAKKAEKEVEQADNVRRDQIKGELEDKLKQEVEDNADGKVGTDDIDDAFEEGEEEQDNGPQNT